MKKPRRYKIKGTDKTVTVEQVRFQHAGRFRGLGTRVTFDDGWKTTFMAATPRKAEQEAAVEQAMWMRSKGDKGE